jgi:hypothetical protein
MASTAEIVRSMKIKTSTLNRLHKEYKYYQQEAEKEHARVEAMKAAGADAHDLKQAVSKRQRSSDACSCCMPAVLHHVRRTLCTAVLALCCSGGN